MSPKKSSRKKNKNPDNSQTKEARKRDKLVTLVVFVLVFVIAWLPLILSVADMGEGDILPFSLSSNQNDGCTQFQDLLETSGSGLEVYPLISSLSVINGIPRNSVLCIFGPSKFFSIIEDVALVDFFQRGGSLLIADDFGSGNSILDGLQFFVEGWPSQLALGTNISAIRFDNRLLLDGDSNDGGRPLLPVMTNFQDGGRIFSANHRVVMNFATGIHNPIPGISIAQSSPNSWVIASHQYWTRPGYNGSRGDEVGPFDLMVEIGVMSGRVVLISDPSIFTNDMINRGDNRLFTIELFTYLAQQANANTVIVDHNHLSWLPTTPALLVGLVIGQITYVSTNWLLAPLAPILALWMVYRYLPFSRPEKQMPREIYRLKGETHFSRTLQEFITKQQYDEALRIIYGKLKRDLRRKYGLLVFDVSRLLVSLSKTRQPSDIALLDADFNDLEKTTQESRRINRDQFLDLFFKIKRIRDNIG